MRFTPDTRQGWFRFLLFPFKAYVIIAPISLMLCRGSTEGRRFRGATAEAAFPIALGLTLCVIVFVIAAIIQLIARRPRVALDSFVFAVATSLLLLEVLPMCATA